MKQIIISFFLFTNILFSQESIIIDHSCVDITQIPESAINDAKQNLHIAYGHTSHGSQLITGMNDLINFANNNGKGLSLSENIFKWNNGGIDGALDLHDRAMGGDAGYFPDWLDNTKAYLDDSTNSDVNVIIWSWCGQVSERYRSNRLFSNYLEPMTQLENEYPNVTFVYMTGHVDINDDEDNKGANDSIRSYCQINKKVLFDFADFDRHDPDGNYYEFVQDNCDYYDTYTSGKIKLGNWATEWQNSHTEGVDWYSCSSAHSQALNANQKAYSAWWLWARLGGWDGNSANIDKNDQDNETSPSKYELNQNYPNPFNPVTSIQFSLHKTSKILLSIYDINGKLIETLTDKVMQPGSYTEQWNASSYSSGIYFYILKTDGFIQKRKCMLLK